MHAAPTQHIRFMQKQPCKTMCSNNGPTATIHSVRPTTANHCPNPQLQDTVQTTIIMYHDVDAARMSDCCVSHTTAWAAARMSDCSVGHTTAWAAARMSDC